MRKIALVLLCGVIAACTSNKLDLKAEEARLLNTSKAWSKAAQTKNVEDILSYWADEAIVYSPGQPTFKGKQAIREMIQQSYKIPGFTISWEPIQATISASGDMAYLLEKNTVSFIDSLGNRITENNRAVTIWRKDKDGNWKNVVDIWNGEPR